MNPLFPEHDLVPLTMTANSSQPGTSSQRSTWIPELAGYRAIAALAVFAFHLASIEPPDGLLGRLTVPLGNAAVSLFFVLSGFLVYRPFANWALLDHTPVVTWRFIIRRLARILPLYWVILTIHFIVTEPDNPIGLGGYLTSYLLVQNFRGSLVFLPPFVAWSLCIELWFSIALPFIAAPIRRAGRGRNLIERTQIQILGLSLLAGSAIVFRVWAVGTPSSGRLLWLPAYFDWFAAGLVLAVLGSYWSARPPELAARQLAANPWFLTSLGILSYWSVAQLGLPGGFVAPTSFQAHSQFLLQGLMSFLLVAAVVLPGANLGRARRFFASRPLQGLGSISYGIYLVHPVITDELIEYFPATPLGLIAPIALVGTLAGAAVLHQLVEAPASRVADRLVLPNRASPGPAPNGRVLPSIPLQPSAAPGPDPSSSEIGRRIGVQGMLVSALAFVSPLLSLPNRYVADSRFELTFAPSARLDRMFVGWDSTRGLGRPAEEFWPFLTFMSSALDGLGVAPWLLQRLIHGSLLALAAVGMLVLAKALDPQRAFAPMLAALLYTFGPASSLYLLPIPLYTSYAAAPWLAVAALKASRQHPLRWAGVVAVVLFLVGNADPPGLILACLPAASIVVTRLVLRPDTRRRLLTFAAAALALTMLASAAMLAKTTIGSAALAHRLSETESVEAVASASSFAESIRGAGFWLLYFRLTPTTFRDHLSLFVTNGWVVMATILPLAAGVAGLGRRPSRTRLLALAWVLLGVVLMVGPFPTASPTPWGRALLELFSTSDAALAFRSTHKAGVILAMGTALLAAWAMHDLAGAIRRLGSRWRRGATLATALAGATIFATIFAPFWSTPMYDDGLSVSAIPDYWSDAAAQLAAEADGRVLVIPGSTNNGYRWGTIGDDLVDVLVPSPVVSTTLPLSTPLAADLIDALNRELASATYQPGTLAPIARRLGITHLLIRNDLAWDLQGLARPKDFAALRADPDLTLVGRHGTPGLFVVNPLAPDETELALSPIEIYRINSATPPVPMLLPDEGAPRTIVVDGTGMALVRLAEHGLLDGGHLTRFVSTIEPQDSQLDDVALVAVTGTTRPLDRRIEYYGYRFAPALEPAEANNWLGLGGPGELTTVGLDGASVTSSVDRWLLGLENQPLHAVDGNSSTAWLVPRLAQASPQQLSIDFDQPASVNGVEIVLVDDDLRLGGVTISVDGVPVDIDRSGDLITLGPAVLNELSIEIESFAPGLASVGVADVRLDLDGADPTRTVSRFPAGIAEFGAALPDDVPALFLLGPDQPSEQPVTADIVTWREDAHRLDLTIITDATATRCLPIVEIDNEPVPMLIRPAGNGLATAEPCSGRNRFLMEPGAHRITVSPAVGDAVVGVRFVSGSLELEPVTRTAIDGETDVDAGDIVVLPASFDTQWELATAEGDQLSAGPPFAVDGLTGFVVANGAAKNTTGLASSHPADALIDRAWLVTWLGLGLAALAIALGGRGQADDQSVRPVTPLVGATRVTRFAPKALLVVCMVSALLFAGPAGLLGAAAAWGLERWRQRSAFVIAAVGLVVVTAYRAWPLLFSVNALISPPRGDGAMRLVIGMLFMAGAEALRRLSLERQTLSVESPR